MKKLLLASVAIFALFGQGSARAGTAQGTGDGPVVTKCAYPVVTTGSSYGTNYVVGGVQDILNILQPQGSGVIEGAIVTIADTETSGFTLFPFSAKPTGTGLTDNNVATIQSTDVQKVRAPISLTGNNQLAASGFSVYYAYGLGLPISPGTTDLNVLLIANAGLTNQFANPNDVQICLKVLQDR